MKSVLLILISCCGYFTLSAQPDSEYQTLISRASLFHLQENYKKALNLYEKAFQIHQPDALTAYKAAGMYSLDSNADKAFQYLQLSLDSGWTEADWLAFDPYFDYLRTTSPEKWRTINEQAFVKEGHYAQTLQLPFLRKQINLMALKDQELRYKRAQNTSDSLAEIISEQINQNDLSNLTKAKGIISKYGWPKISQVGKDGQNNLWLIVQHADQDVMFQQTALKAMEKLKETKELNMENYAFLYDRVQCNLNYKQLYGTQVAWTNNGEASAFRPIIKEYQTDERREKIGLQPLRSYALTYGFSYQEVNDGQSEQKDRVYRINVQHLIDSAKYFYTKKRFRKTYDFYNAASTFLGGMSNTDNFEAAVIFSKVAAIDNDQQYKKISLDFLELLFLRSCLSKEQLYNQPAFRILHKEQRWSDLNKKLKH